MCCTKRAPQVAWVGVGMATLSLRLCSSSLLEESNDKSESNNKPVRTPVLSGIELDRSATRLLIVARSGEWHFTAASFHRRTLCRVIGGIEKVRTLRRYS